MTDMREALKPCPFCGGAAEMIHGAPGCHFARCTQCKADTFRYVAAPQPPASPSAPVPGEDTSACPHCHGEGSVKSKHTFGKGWKYEACPVCAGTNDIAYRGVACSGISVILTQEEARVLAELSAKTDLSEERILINALRLYQLQDAGMVTPTPQGEAAASAGALASHDSAPVIDNAPCASRPDDEATISLASTKWSDGVKVKSLEWRVHRLDPQGKPHAWASVVGAYEIRLTHSLGDGTWSYTVDNAGECALSSREQAERGAHGRLVKAIARDEAAGARARSALIPAPVSGEAVAWLAENKITGSRELIFQPMADLPFNRKHWRQTPLGYLHPSTAFQAGAEARELAELVLSMEIVTPAGQHARHLARKALGISDPNHTDEDVVAITTNGTTRFIPRDEPVFLLRGQDHYAASAVRHWAKLMEEDIEQTVPITRLAREHALKMAAWPKKKVPDLPLPQEAGR